MPLPRRRNTLPDWVSAGMRILAEPSSVGISISPPSAAAVMLIGISQCRSLASRVNTGCAFTRHTTYRSPGGPPLTPASPSPDRRMRSPSSTPAGILTESVFCRLTRPAPWQVAHGSRITLPVPLQRGQVCAIEKKPCWIRTWPWPPQAWQVVGSVPGLAPRPWQVSHSSSVGTRILVSVPRAASSEDLAEDISEGIGKTTETCTPRSAHPRVRIHAGMTEAIVGRALVSVAQHLVCLFRLLELLLGLGVIRIAVR